ncbi:hypothetical protein LEP1GSC044_1450 [Leptospira kirschneri serovar Grippotyphosa str. RM52]|nr:hypothetical protein LEP1GSC044_1450 [Leptospira kirschneri serovar Grippotyphosa str. RM52]
MDESAMYPEVSIHFLFNKRKKLNTFDNFAAQSLFQSTSSLIRERN